MEDKFFDLYEQQSNLALEVGHNSVADWCVTIYDKQGRSLADAEPAVIIQESVRDLAIAKAYVALCEYLSEHRGGY